MIRSFENAMEEDKKHIMSNVEIIKEKANLFRAEIRKLDKTSEDVEMIIAIAKQEVSEAAELVITKTRRREKQLLESLKTTLRKRIVRINSAKRELESLVQQINQAAEFAENLVQRSSGFDIIQTKTTLRDKFEDLRGVEVPKYHQTNLSRYRNKTSNWVSFNSPRNRQTQLNQLWKDWIKLFRLA